jgi:hypothetical protein
MFAYRSLAFVKDISNSDTIFFVDQRPQVRGIQFILRGPVTLVLIIDCNPGQNRIV